MTDDGAWSGAVGTDGRGEPLLPETAMAIGPITSTFTAAEVLLLADQGLVDLNAPISDYVALPFDTRGATVRDVLGMRSGFTADAVGEFVEMASADPDQVLTSADTYALVDSDDPPSGEVGQEPSSYNPLNFLVLGDLIENVTRHSYAAALRSDLLDPAGLGRVWVQDTERPVPPVAIAVEDTGDELVVDPDGSWLPSRALATGAGAAAALASDASTLAAWGLGLYTGQILDQDLVDQMTTVTDGGWYGLGTVVQTDRSGNPMVGHQGLYGYTSTLMVWPQEAIAVAVLSPQYLSWNTIDGHAERLHNVWVSN